MFRKVLSGMILLLGLGLLSYPLISNYLESRNGSYVSDEYQQASAKLTAQENRKLRAAAEAYNESIGGSRFPDPFTDEVDTASANYRQLLAVNDQMAVIEIPKIAVNLPIYHGTNESVLQKGIGHMEGSALPIGGTSRHTVVTGHTGLKEKKLFTNLTSLEVGDEFYFTVLGETLAYQVDQIKVVEPEDSQPLQVVEGQDHATLLTCTPYGVNSHRLLVRGVRVPYDAKKKAATKKVNTLTAEQLLLLKIGGATAAVMLVLIVITWRIKRCN